MEDEWHESTLNADDRAAEAARRLQMQREASIEAAEREVDEVLLEALDSRDRMTVLRFEQVLYKFMKNGSAGHQDFPSLGSYHRLLLHKVVNRFQLMAQPLEEAYGPGMPPGHCGIRVWKLEHSRLPNAALFKLVQVRQRRNSASQAAPDPSGAGASPSRAGAAPMMRQPNRVLKRDPRRQPKASTQGAKNESKQQPQQSREAAYAAARARIFGESPTSSPSESQSTSPSPSPNPEGAAATTGKSRNRRRKPRGSLGSTSQQSASASAEWRENAEAESADAPDPEPELPSSTVQQREPERVVLSAGPDAKDDVGFNLQRGGGREGLRTTVAQAKEGEEAGPGPGDSYGERPSGPDIAEEGAGADERSGAVDASEWIETRARRRSGVELQDPDFNRNYAYYRPNYPPQARPPPGPPPPTFFAVQPAQVAVYVESPPAQGAPQHPHPGAPPGAPAAAAPRVVYVPAGSFAGAMPSPGGQAGAPQPGFAYQGLYQAAPITMASMYGPGGADPRMMPHSQGQLSQGQLSQGQLSQGQLYAQNVNQQARPAASQARAPYGQQPRGYFAGPRPVAANNTRTPSSYQENFPPLG